MAFGASTALEDILKEQMVRAQLAQQEQERAARLRMDETRLNASLADQEDDRKFRARQEDRMDADRRGKSNQAGVRRMIGDSLMQRTGPMTPEDRRSIAALQVEAGDLPDMSLLTEPKPLRQTVTTIGKRGEPVKKLVTEDELAAGVPEYREPKAPPAGPKAPQFVRMPDGSIKDINGIAPPGAVPFDAVGERQQAATKAGGDRAVEAMRTYGDDMLSVINDMIDENGNLKPEVAGVVGGFDGARPEWAYGKEGSQKALAAINRLQGMLDLQKLGEMKQQSRTGASGFGALSEKELAVLEGAASTLRNRRQGDASYGSELKRIRDTINGGRQVAPAAAQPAPGGAPKVDLIWDGSKFVKPGGGA